MSGDAFRSVKERQKSVKERQKVLEFVKTDFNGALRIAKEIPDPWYRCQSLSFVAAEARDRKTRLSLIGAAFDAALACQDPNRVATVSTWPLRVLVESSAEAEVHRHAERLLQLIRTEPHPVRRGDAQSHILSALYAGPRPDFLNAFRDFVDSCKQAHSWRLDEICRRFAPWLNSIDPTLTPVLLDCIRKPKVRRLAERDVAHFAERSGH
jgi:hypothetical protein